MDAESSILTQSLKQYALDIEKETRDARQCSARSEGLRYALNRFYELFPGARPSEDQLSTRDAQPRVTKESPLATNVKGTSIPVIKRGPGPNGPPRSPPAQGNPYG